MQFGDPQKVSRLQELKEERRLQESARENGLPICTDFNDVLFDGEAKLTRDQSDESSMFFHHICDFGKMLTLVCARRTLFGHFPNSGNEILECT